MYILTFFRLLAFISEVNLARTDFFLTSLPAFFIFFIYSRYCVLSPTDVVSRHVSVLQADRVLRFCLHGPVSPTQHSESNIHVLSIAELAC